MKTNNLLLAVLAFVIIGCTEDFTPKPKGFNHIPLPKHSYVLLTDSTSPYSFEYAKIAKRFSSKNSQLLVGRVKNSVCGAIAEHTELIVMDVT